MTPVDLLDLVLALLAAALVLSLAAARLHLPPAAALVLGGMALALVPGVPAVTLDPDLVLVLFLPPLLLASAYFTVWRDFRADLRPILLLSVGAVAFTTLVVGVVARWVAPALPWATCFALGAIVSPPDAVAAKAVLTGLRLPRRLVTILEGESLVNDASGLVLYRFAVAAALTGTFSPARAAASFAWVAVGGIGAGLVLGLVVTALIRRLSDTRLVVVTSFLAAWTSYIAADRIGASGVLSTVACGILMGWRQHEGLGARARTQASAVWDVAVFVLEALIFVLIGLALRGVLDRLGGGAGQGQVPWEDLALALAVTAAVIVSRFAWVYPAVYLPRLILGGRDPGPPPAIPAIISWAGMRGVVSLAAALALPEGFPGRDPVLLASFGVILVTVLVQGTTLGPLIRLVRLGATTARGPQGPAFLGEAETRLRVSSASLTCLEGMVAPEDSRPLHPQLMEDYRTRVRIMTRVRQMGDALDGVKREHFAAALAALGAGRAELIRLHRSGSIHDTTLHAIEGELDLEELRLHRLSGAGPAGH